MSKKSRAEFRKQKKKREEEKKKQFANCWKKWLNIVKEKNEEADPGFSSLIALSQTVEKYAESQENINELELKTEGVKKITTSTNHWEKEHR